MRALILVPVAVLAAGVGWAAPSLLARAGVVPYNQNVLSQLGMWTDPETNCQYLVTDTQPMGLSHAPTGITPRLRPDGLPVCGPL
jgi:hypothetical protein